MRIEISNEGRVIAWSADDLYNEQMFDVPNDTLPEDFEENAFFYIYKDGTFVFDPAFKEGAEHEQKVVEIRNHREQICFPIINRGQAWYWQLTDEQKKDLSEWYQAWLDATDTMTEPPMPEWLERTV